ncbi:hypothetical protein TYRP_013098 [Tyrophagus putrescentiae]|nr:hypothetical protein TYRP_013098 [Tyrophagus putrescentiae]
MSSSLFFRHFPRSSARTMAIIGMVHVRALPGSPRSALSVQQLVDIACEEAAVYSGARLDGICLENMFDVPYVKAEDAGPETIAVMTRVANEVRRITPASVPVGVQVLAAQNRAAMAVALAAGLQFIRAEGFVGADDQVAILTDIKKKHCSHSITADVDIVDTAKAAKFFLSDGMIITGRETGDSPDIEEVARVRAALPDEPIIVGSGVTERNVGEFSRAGVNAAIVGLVL